MLLEDFPLVTGDFARDSPVCLDLRVYKPRCQIAESGSALGQTIQEKTSYTEF